MGVILMQEECDCISIVSSHSKPVLKVKQNKLYKSTRL
jgi:hypothetical protein